MSSKAAAAAARRGRAERHGPRDPSARQIMSFNSTVLSMPAPAPRLRVPVRHDHFSGMPCVGGVWRGAEDAERRTTGSQPPSPVSPAGIVWYSPEVVRRRSRPALGSPGWAPVSRIFPQV
jgi:hypothetical protein